MANSIPPEFEDSTDPGAPPNHFKDVLDARHGGEDGYELLEGEDVRYHLRRALEGDISGDVESHIRAALERLETDHRSE
jgi:hypothetical protein